jgi:hypothetical protein
MDSPVRAGMTAETVTARLAAHFAENIPVRDQEAIMYRVLDSFRQIARAPAEISEAAAETEEVAAAIADDARHERDDPELDLG